MSPMLLFLLLLVLTFGVLIYFLRPTRMETAIQRQLGEIAEGRRAGAVDVTILKEETFAASPWMTDMAKWLPGSPPVQKLIEQAGKHWPAPLIIMCSLGAALVGGWVASIWIPAPLICVVVGVAAGFIPCVYLYVLREMRFSRCDKVFPEAVDLMSRALRAGLTIQAGMEMVGREVPDPVGIEFRRITKEQNLGLPMRDAVHSLAERLPRDDVRFFTTAVLVQKETGGNLAHILDKASEVMRERARLRGQIKIYSAQGRLTGWILCMTPFLLFGLIELVNRDYEKILLTDPLGILLVEIGLVMMVIGVLIIRKIIDIRV